MASPGWLFHARGGRYTGLQVEVVRIVQYGREKGTFFDRRVRCMHGKVNFTPVVSSDVHLRYEKLYRLPI